MSEDLLDLIELLELFPLIRGAVELSRFSVTQYLELLSALAESLVLY